MKWDVKLFIVSLLVYVIFLGFNYLETDAVVAPLFLNVFYLPLFPLVLAVSTPYSFGSIICLFLGLGHLAWPMEVYGFETHKYLVFGSAIGYVLAGAGFAVVSYAKRTWTTLTRVICAVFGASLLLQIVNLFAWKNEQVVEADNVVTLIAGYLLLFPKITTEIPYGQQRAILAILLGVSYNYLMNLTV